MRMPNDNQVSLLLVRLRPGIEVTNKGICSRLKLLLNELKAREYQNKADLENVEVVNNSELLVRS